MGRLSNSTLEVRTPLRRTGFARGRGGALRRRPPRRLKRDALFRPYVTWLHGDGKVCIVCGTSTNIQGSHVGEGGMGQKRGRDCDMVRMCGPGGNDCHGQWGERRGVFEFWTREERDRASVTWRIVHWEAFSAWAGVFTETQYRSGTPDNEAVKAVVVCEGAISFARAFLMPARRAA